MKILLLQIVVSDSGGCWLMLKIGLGKRMDILTLSFGVGSDTKQHLGWFLNDGSCICASVADVQKLQKQDWTGEGGIGDETGKSELCILILREEHKSNRHSCGWDKWREREADIKTNKEGLDSKTTIFLQELASTHTFACAHYTVAFDKVSQSRVIRSVWMLLNLKDQLN